jgi:hypothetical protein
MSTNRHCIVPCALPILAAVAITMPGWAADQAMAPIWWEAESAARTTMTTDGYFPSLTPEQCRVLSGGKMLNGQADANATAFAEYDLEVPTAGTYDLFQRKWWEHGAYRWRFDDGAWVTVGDGQRTFDPVDMGGNPINWMDLGYVPLTAGHHVFRLEMLPNSTYRFAKPYGFDCFVLASPGYVPAGISHEGAVSHFIAIKEADFGKNLPRTMALLRSATPTHRTRLKVLGYGQSIVANSQAASMLVKHLQEAYPNAEISFRNTAIGGYQAPMLRKTCWYDLYPEYPDLVIFHDYGGEKTGEFEEMYRNLRRFTTAEVLTWTHHVDNFAAGVDAERDVSSEFLKEMAQKYGYEIADVRSAWKERLKHTHESPQAYLLDQIHLNGAGTQLLYDTLLPHLRVNPQASDLWRKQVIDLPLEQGGAVAYTAADAVLRDGQLVTQAGGVVKVSFCGNRLDLSALPSGGAQAVLEFTLDGRKPSECPSGYAATRPTLAPSVWWPSINLISLGDRPVAQDYVLSFTGVSPDGKTYAFSASGSVSGDEGSGAADKDFTSRSGTCSIKAEDVAFKGVKEISGKDMPKEFTVAFSVRSMSRDRLAIDAHGTDVEAAMTTIIQCREDKPHTVEIRTTSGPAAIAGIRVYSPSAGNSLEWPAR